MIVSRSRVWLNIVGSSIIVAGAVVSILTGFHHTPNLLQLPISNTAQQNYYADQVTHFVETHTEPQRGGSSVAAQNAYWKAEVDYWNPVPWKAVAGQWGCSFQSVKVSYNPVDKDGVRSAGYRAVTNCGNAGDSIEVASTTPSDATSMLLANPTLAKEYGQQ